MSKQKSKLRLIADGWINLLWDDEEIEKLARERAAICAKCPNSEIAEAYTVIPMKGIQLAKGVRCKLCTCPLTTALRSPGYVCPDSPPRWDAK